MCIFIGEGVILDRSVYSDCVFANVGRSEGYISKEGKCSCCCVNFFILMINRRSKQEIGSSGLGGFI